MVRVVSANDHQHVTGSAHYKDAAVDVQGDNLDGLAVYLRKYGATVYWRSAGHWTHLHAEIE